jgi:hypothetical protein
MDAFISEPITPDAGTFAIRAMAAGLPGLPQGFTWRGQHYQIDECLETWKQSAPEGGRPGGERYLRRHYFRLRMDDRSVWTIYLVRTTPRSGSPKRRWFLYRMDASVD